MMNNKDVILSALNALFSSLCINKSNRPADAAGVGPLEGCVNVTNGVREGAVTEMP